MRGQGCPRHTRRLPEEKPSSSRRKKRSSPSNSRSQEVSVGAETRRDWGRMLVADGREKRF